MRRRAVYESPGFHGSGGTNRRTEHHVSALARGDRPGARSIAARRRCQQGHVDGRTFGDGGVPRATVQTDSGSWAVSWSPGQERDAPEPCYGRCTDGGEALGVGDAAFSCFGRGQRRRAQRSSSWMACPSIRSSSSDTRPALHHARSVSSCPRSSPARLCCRVGFELTANAVGCRPGRGRGAALRAAAALPGTGRVDVPARFGILRIFVSCRTSARFPPAIVGGAYVEHDHQTHDREHHRPREQAGSQRHHRCPTVDDRTDARCRREGARADHREWCHGRQTVEPQRGSVVRSPVTIGCAGHGAMIVRRREPVTSTSSVPGSGALGGGLTVRGGRQAAARGDQPARPAPSPRSRPDRSSLQRSSSRRRSASRAVSPTTMPVHPPGAAAATAFG